MRCISAEATARLSLGRQSQCVGETVADLWALSIPQLRGG